MLLAVILIGYALIFLKLAGDFRSGVTKHKASLSYWKYGILPRFTVREPNGRFKANKVGFWYVATH